MDCQLTLPTVMFYSTDPRGMYHKTFYRRNKFRNIEG
jgi:hypothetical protein